MLIGHPDIRVNEKEKGGNTALLYAVYKGHAEIVRHLVTHRDTDVNEKDREGNTALLVAVRE